MDKQEVERRPFMAGRISHHEVPNGPVEDGLVVVALLTQTDEILSSFGNLQDRTFRDQR